MEKVFGNGAIKLDVRLENQNFEVALTSNAVAGASMTLEVPAYALVDKVIDLIPGTWEDDLLEQLAQKLLGKRTNQTSTHP